MSAPMFVLVGVIVIVPAADEGAQPIDFFLVGGQPLNVYWALHESSHKALPKPLSPLHC